MGRPKDKGRQGTKTATAGLHSVSAQENQMLWREAGLQTLSEVKDSMCIQGHATKGCTKDRLYGDA